MQSSIKSKTSCSTMSSQRMGLDMTYSQLAEQHITVGSVNSTQIMAIYGDH